MYLIGNFKVKKQIVGVFRVLVLDERYLHLKIQEIWKSWEGLNIQVAIMGFVFIYFFW